MSDEKKTVIFELQLQSTDMKSKLDELTKTQKAINTSTEEGRKQYAQLGAEIKTLSGLYQQNEKSIKANIAATNAQAGSYNELKAQIALAKESLNKLTIGSDEYAKKEAELNTLLAKEIEIRTAQKSLFQERIKGAINESEVTLTLTQQYKALQVQLQGLADAGKVGTQEFTNLAKQAGEVKDKINEGKEAAKAFATGSNLEQFGNVLGNIKGDLTNLDFSGAAEKAKQLADVAKSMTFASAVESAKALGATLIETGKALLRNPLFIMAAVIAAVGTALYQLNQRAEENKKAFDDASKSLDDYEKGLRNLENAANDSADALAESQGKISSAELARNKRKRQLDADLVQAQEELDKQLQDSRDKKELNDESREIIQTRAIKDNVEKRKLLEKQAADDLAKIELDATIAKIDADNERAEKKIADDEKRAKDNADRFKAELQSTEDIITEAAEKRFLKQNEEDLKKIEAEKALREEILKLEFEYQQKFDEQKKKQFDKDIQQLAEATKLEDEYLNTKTENAIQREKDAQEVIMDNTILTEEKKQALIAASEKKITEIKNAEVVGRLQTANTAFGQLASLEAAFNTDSKAGATAQGLINTYLSATQALGAYPPPLSFIAAGIATAAGLAQVAKINGVQFYEGGFTERGNPREATRNLGPRPYIYHKNEYIVPDKVLSTPEGALHVMQLETMRKGTRSISTGLNGFQDGGLASRAVTDRAIAEASNETMANMNDTISRLNLFISVGEINQAQKEVQVTESRNTI